MKKYLHNYALLITFSVLLSFYARGQRLFYSETLNGGVTGVGFSAGFNSATVSSSVLIEPGSTIKKAFLFQYRNNYPDSVSALLFEWYRVYSRHLKLYATKYNSLSNTLTNPTHLYYWDLTNVIDPSITTYNVDLPMLPASANPGAYLSRHLFGGVL
jgi:hypothetical protein